MVEERRRHARVAVERRCTLVGPAGIVDGTMRDFSRVGAKIATDERVAAEGERVELRCEDLVVPARVMYSRPRDGKILSGIQFVEVDAARDRALTAFLEAMLAGGGGGQRAHPRVQLRARVVCSSPRRATGVLQDVSRGGIRVLLDQPAQVGDEITVEVVIGKLDRPLVLAGSVVRVESDDESERHVAGVRLGELTPADASLLAKLLAALTGAE
jgi:hypothetical protein